MANNTLKKITLYTLGAISGVALSVGVQSFAADKSEDLPIQSLKTMAEVYSQVKANYVNAESDSKLIENAIKGMVSGLDPHSEYMDKKEYKEFQEHTTGEFGGLGMEIGMEDGFILVVSPIEDTPAERAGIRSGDLIVKINEQSTRGMLAHQAAKKMRGKPGTTITLTLSRKDSTKPIVLKLTRAIIKVRSVRAHLLEPDYGYIRVSQFQEKTVPALQEGILDLIKQNNNQPLKGLVLDLRDDPGGLLNGAVGVSAAFLPQDAVVVSTKGRDNRPAMLLKAKPEDYITQAGKDPLANLPANLKDIPLTVLINSGSASASEIVAGALQDHKRAVVVGTRSFGKGSVQSLMPLSNGAAMKITTALYYTPNDRSIQATGIVPDVEVKDKNRTYESREADLAGHIDNPLGEDDVKGEVNLSNDESDKNTKAADSKPSEEKEDISERRKPNPEKDEQLRTALNLVKSPEQWQKSLGLAAKKPIKPKKKDDGEDESEE